MYIHFKNMKFNFLFILILLVALTGCEEMFSKITSDDYSEPQSVEWLNITGMNNTSMPQMNDGAVTDTAYIAIEKTSSNLYAAWIESPDIRVKQFNNDVNNPQWHENTAGLISTTPNGGLNLYTYNDQLHIAYCDNGRVIVMYLDKSTGQWHSMVDTAFGVGSISPTANPVLVGFQGSLYVLFRQTSAPSYLRMFRFTGGDQWIEIADDASPADGVNGNSNNVNYGPSVAVTDSRLYIAYTEYTSSDKLKIRPFNGTQLETPDINNANFNFWDVTDQDQFPSIIAVANEIYAGWKQLDSAGTQSRFSVFKRKTDGDWYSIDNGINGFPQGIREIDSNNTNLLKPHLVPINGRVCAMAADPIFIDPGTATLWAKTYNGQQDGGYHDWLWAGIEEDVDGLATELRGINYYSSGGWVDNFNAVEFNNELYVIYVEAGGTLYSVRGR